MENIAESQKSLRESQLDQIKSLFNFEQQTSVWEIISNHYKSSFLENLRLFFVHPCKLCVRRHVVLYDGENQWYVYVRNICQMMLWDKIICGNCSGSPRMKALNIANEGNIATRVQEYSVDVYSSVSVSYKNGCHWSCLSSSPKMCLFII